MRNCLYFFLLLIVFSSCNRKLALIGYDQNGTVSQKQKSNPVELEINLAHQTKKTIAFEVSISNQSDEIINIDPNDFFYTPEDYSYSIDAFDPEFLRFQIEHPLEAIAENAQYDYANSTVWMDVALLSDIAFETDMGYISMSGIRFLKYWSEIRDSKKVLIEELLEEQNLKAGAKVRGLIYFPKKEFKTKRLIFINWEKEDGVENRRFLVDKWKK